jgi:hypothetical protein
VKTLTPHRSLFPPPSRLSPGQPQPSSQYCGNTRRDRHHVCLYFTKGTNIYCNILLKLKTSITWCSQEGKETVYMNDTSSHMEQKCQGETTSYEANNSISKPYNELDNSQEHTSSLTKNMAIINMYNSELNNIYDLWIHDSPS